MPPLISAWTKSLRHGRLSKRRKTRHSRPFEATVQYLEPRLLLTIDNLAAISGVVYDDLTDDGLTADDVRQENAAVEVFRDGGDLTFNNGGGDDVSLGTVMTDASGSYRFDGLTAGRYFAVQDTVVGLIQRTGEDVVTVDISSLEANGVMGTLIDAFDDPDPPPDPPQSAAASSSGSLTGSSTSMATGVIGMERDLFIELTSPTGGINISANQFNLELLEFNSSTTAAGNGTVVWDGADGDPLAIDHTGLGGVDLTDAGASTGIRLVAGVDQNGVVATVRVYSDATSFSEGMMIVPNTGGSANDEFLIAFSSFVQSGGASAPADFTNVGAIELVIAGVTAADGQVGLVAARGPTVKAASFANFQPLSLGNLVWNDLNNNGQFDSGTESGIADVTVELYSDTDGSGDFTAGTDLLVDSMTTDGSGNYLFTTLFPGEYVVRIPQTELDPGGDLERIPFSSTGNDPAPDPDTNVNNDDNGELLSGQGAVTQAVSLFANTEPTNDDDADTDTNLSVDFGFFQPIDLAITKTDSADPVNAGSTFVYTLTVTNDGSETATGVTATDVLPAGVGFTSGSASQGTVSESAGTVTATIGSLASGASATVTINVTVDNDTIGAVLNNASVVGDQFDPDTSNNSTTEPTAVTPVVDLVVTKSDSADPVNAGDPLTYTVTVTNDGPSSATSVELTDTLPAGVSFTSVTTTVGTASESGGVVTADIGTLADGASAVVTITVGIDNSTLGTITNTASVTAAETELDATNNTVTEPTAVTAVVDVSVTKVDDVDPINAGSQLTYTLVVSNAGPSTATSVSVIDTLPAGVSYSSGSSTLGTVSESGGVVTATIGTIASGASETITLIVDVAGTTNGTITNSATVTASETDSNTGNNSASENTTITPVIDLTVSKSDNPDAVNAGATLTYTVLVTNNGPSPATAVTLTDLLPAEVSFDSGSSTQGSVSESGGTVTAAIGTLASGASATVTLTTTVADSAIGLINNSVSVTATETELNSANNSDAEPTTVTPVVDVAISKSDDVDPVDAGGTLVYTLSVSNAGPSTATGVTITDSLPADVSFVSATTTQGSVSESGGVVTVNLGTLANAGSAMVTVTVTAADDAVGTVTNTATVSTNEADTNTANNTTSEDTTINPVVDLVVTKSDSVDPVNAGEPLTYTVTVTNDGPSSATSVELTDTLPAGVSFTSVTTTAGTASESGGVVTADIGTLANGASAVVTITVGIDNSTRGTITNTASVNSAETELDATDNTVTEPTVVTPVVDLSVSKVDDVDPINAGSQLTYTLVVSNAGPSTATGVTLTDTLPAGVSYSSGSSTVGTVSESGGVITAMVGMLASGASETITLIVDVAGTTSGTITNNAVVAASETDTNTANNSVSEDTAVTAVVDLSVTKSDNPDAVDAGATLTYTVLVTNNGPSPATNVTLTDLLPAEVSFDSGSSTQGSVSESGGTVTAAIGTLASGASATVTITTTVANTASGLINNTASVTATETELNSGNNSDTEPTTVTPIVDVSITKSDNVDPVNAGGAFVYTLTISNDGPSIATGVTVTDMLPSGVSFTSGSGSQGTVTEAGGIVTASLGTLASGASATVTLNVSVADSAVGTVTNSASVSSVETDSNTANNSATEQTTITPVVDVLVTKIDSEDPVNAGGTLIYTMLVRNDGPSTATSVMLTDALPAGTSFQSALSSQGSVSESGGIVTASLGTLASGGTATVTVNVAIDASTVGTLTNTASVTASEMDTNSSNNSDSESTTVTPVVDLVVTKSDSIDPVNAGGSVVYTLTVSNNGPSTATGVIVTDLLPAEVTYSSGSASQGTVSESGGTVTADVGTLASGATATVTLNVDVADSADGTITNSVSVTGNENETDATNNSATEPTLIVPVVDVRIEKMDSADPVDAGGAFAYTLSVTNDGPSIATGVVVTDSLPSDVTFTSGSASQGTVSESSGTVTVNLGTLASGASATITFNVDVADAASGTLTNTVSVATNETDTNLANNVDSEATGVTPLVDLAVTKSDSVDPVNAGGSFAYTLTVTNNGPSTATGVTLTDVLPSGVTFDSGSASQGTVSESGGVVTASLASLASGASATVTLNVNVLDATTGTVTNTASVTGVETDTDTTNNSASELTTVIPVVDVLVTKSDTEDPVNAGGTLVYTMFIRNNGPSTATGVVVTDMLPAGVAFNSASASQGTVTESGGTVTVNVGTLASGAEVTVTLNADVADSTTGTLTNTVTVSANETETDESNNSDSETTTINPIVDLAITKSDNADPVTAGEALTYTLNVTNNGPSAATGVVVSDLLPSGVTFTSGSASQGTVSENNGTVTVSLGSLASGASATVTLNVAVSINASGILTNTASVSSSELDTSPSNNTATEPTTVTPPPISSLAGLVYIDLNNNGQFDATDMRIPGVAISLVPIDATGNVSGAAVTQVTDSNGEYNFTAVTAGRYRLVQTQPTAFNQGSESVGSSGGTNPLDNVIDEIVLGVGEDATGYDFGEGMPVLSKRRFLASSGTSPTMGGASTQAALSGRVFSDTNSDGIFDGGDSAIAGVTVSLMPINASGNDTGPALIAVSDANGVYRFSEVKPGRYRLFETQPAAYAQGVEVVGSAGGTNTNPSDDTIDSIDLGSGTDGIGYDFADGLFR